MISNAKLLEMIELSNGATDGPWEHRVHGANDFVFTGTRFYGHEATPFLVEDAKFIASANPSTISALCEELLEARRVIKFYADDETLSAEGSNYTYEHLEDDTGHIRILEMRNGDVETIGEYAKAHLAKYLGDDNE